MNLGTGIALQAPTIAGWFNVPLKALLEERTGLHIELRNDANLAALGEWRLGSGRNCEHFVYVTISTGLGGGVIVDNRLLLGRDGLAGVVASVRTWLLEHTSGERSLSARCRRSMMCPFPRLNLATMQA